MRSAKDNALTGNMREEHEDVEKLCGKKLVQARLPFKVIAVSDSSPASCVRKGSDVAIQPAINPDSEKEVFQEGRKRKLSFEDEEHPKGASVVQFAIKENVTLNVKKSKIDVPEVTLFNNKKNDDKEAIESDILSAGSETEAHRPQKVARKRKDASTQGKNSNTNVQIKLPFGGRQSKKRRKFMGDLVKEVETAYDLKTCSNDEAEIPCEEPDPQKRSKVDKNKTESNTTEKEVIVTIDLESDSDAASVDDYVDMVSRVSSSSSSNTDYSCSDTPQNIKMISFKLTEKKGVKPNANSTGAILIEDSVETSNAESAWSRVSHGTKACKVNGRDEKLDSDRVYIKNSDLPDKDVERKQSDANVSKHCTNDVKEKIVLHPLGEITTKLKNTYEQQSILMKKCDESIVLDSSESTEAASVTDGVKLRGSDVMICDTQKHCASKKHLTPKQLKLMNQRRHAREEKERRLQEEKLQKQREKELKQLVRKREREERDEQRRKEREEREDQKRKEREEKERKRLAELEVKHEEKRKRHEAREEELRKREEERRRKEQEKEEADIKAKKAAEAFQKFFKLKRSLGAAEVIQEVTVNKNVFGVQEILAFRPFEIKGDMKLAPVCRKTLSPEKQRELDNYLGLLDNRSSKNVDKEDNAVCQEMLPVSQLYLAQLKSGKIIPSKWGRRTLDKKEFDNDVVVVEDELERAGQAIVEETHGPIEFFRAKFYKFWENRRPPYFGTWRKKTEVITPRRPFAQDKKYFDYEIDSDLEWEEEEPGESLDGSDDDKEKESEDDDYEVDNEWFVPHGHLSEEELQNEDDIDANTREAQKAKLQILQKEFAQEMKKKTEKIKPRLIGCVWADEKGNQPALCPKIIWDTLSLRGILCAAPPAMDKTEVPERTELNSPSIISVEKVNDKLKPIKINEQMLKDLTRLVHGNRHSKDFIIKEFIAYLESNEDAIKNGNVRGPLKSMVREKIDEYAKWTIIEAGTGSEVQQKKNKKRLCWIVADNVLHQMGLEKLSLQNNWQYTLQPKFVKTGKTSNAEKVRTQSEEDTVAAADEDNLRGISVGSEKMKSKGNWEISKFAKDLTDEKKTLQLLSSANESGDALKQTSNQKRSPNLANLKPQVTTPMRPVSATKKRVPLLMSVARGQEISQTAKKALISEYLKRSSNEKVKVTITSEVNDVTDDEVIMLN